MQEDKKLQSLLVTHAMHEPAAGFDDKVMQLVAAKETKHLPEATLISASLQRILIAVFIVIALALLAIACFINPRSLLAAIEMPVLNSPGMPLFSFFIAFWIVMLLNLWWNKKHSVIDASV